MKKIILLIGFIGLLVISGCANSEFYDCKVTCVKTHPEMWNNCTDCLFIGGRTTDELDKFCFDECKPK